MSFEGPAGGSFIIAETGEQEAHLTDMSIPEET